MAGKITIRDIARLAGVSTTTVSRVLNQKPDVDQATREKILQIIAEHGFVPSVTASGLAGRSRLIGVLVPSFTWPIIPEIMRGIAEEVRDTSYELILYSVSDTTREYEECSVINRILTTQLTAGILAVLPGHLSQQIARLHTPQFPVVTIDDQDIPPITPWIGADNLSGGQLATTHLIDLGHQRIAHIQGPMKYLCSRERDQGYRQALQKGGLSWQAELALEGDFTEESGYKAASELFSRRQDQQPTAIFASSDLMAFGAITAAHEHGLRIPEDIALIGFDDIVFSTHVRPALTTIHQPFYEMGLQGMQLLLSLLQTPPIPPMPSTMERQYPRFNRVTRETSTPEVEITHGHHNTEPIRIQLATRLVVRSSCGSSPLTIPSIQRN